MNKNFIMINNSVFDYKRYIKEVEWLKYDVKRRILDLFEKEFLLLEEFEERYDVLRLVFYNKRLDIRLKVECLKQSQEVFI